MVQNIPDVVSGTLTFQVDQAVHDVENYTGDSISVTSIGEKYQPAVVNLTISTILSLMEGQGFGVKSIKVDDLNITKGLAENTSKGFETLAYKQLSNLGTKMSYFTTWN